MSRKVVVTQDPELPVETEVLAEAIVAISASAKKLLGGKLKKRAVLVLIQDASPRNLTLSDIEAVLDTAADLEKRYVNL